MTSARENAARIARLLEPFVQPGEPPLEEQARQIAAYLELLLRWNQRINLTAVRQPEEIVSRHFGESIFAAQHLLPPDSAAEVADLGSGAGFPGLPLKIVRPGVRLTLIESNSRKAAFLNEAARAIGLPEVRVLNARAETVETRFELVTLRAVERFDQAAPIAAGLVGPGGRLALLIGEAQVTRAKQLLPSFHWQNPLAIPQSRARELLIGSAIAG